MLKTEQKHQHITINIAVIDIVKVVPFEVVKIERNTSVIVDI